MVEKTASNTQEVSVSELSQALKRTVEDRFGFVRVRGEISGYRGPHSSGHCYFCLKDQNAKIDAVVWKGVFAKLRVRPEEGMEVVATGKLTTFPGKSSYQIVIDTIEPAGVGAIMALLEERRRRLAAEGLFDDGRKQLLPYLPEVIGVVTSPTGAVIRDILHRIADRFPRRVIVWPVRVQGETCAAEVTRAIEGFNAFPEGGAIPRPDVIIVARGGGSLEDLLGFSEESVVRAAASSLLPLVSAVGHETDWTLIDHAADVRAPTPTAAAEMCVPVRADLLTQIRDLSRRHVAATSRLIDRRRTDLRGLTRALPSGEAIVAVPRQRLDRAGERLTTSLEAGVRTRRIRLERASRGLATQSPQARMARAEQKLDALGKRLEQIHNVLTDRRRQQLDVLDKRLATAFANRLGASKQKIGAHRDKLAQMEPRLRNAFANMNHRRAARLQSLAQLLGTLGYKQVLARGYAVVRDANNRPLRSAQIEAGSGLSIEFADGKVNAVTTGGAPPPARPKPVTVKPTRSAPVKSQGSLF
jgi:exodeoxyribonuclease VII large subunit